jgi:hypothetical protein
VIDPSCPAPVVGGSAIGAAPLHIAAAGVGLPVDENDGVGRDGYGRGAATGSAITGVVGRAEPPTAGLCSGVSGRGTDVFVNGVVAPTAIRTIAPHTLHRARTPFGGTLAGSTRNTERQS